MSVRHISLGLSALALSTACQNYSAAAVVFATDFNSTTPGTYGDNVVLNSGGITTDNVTLRSAAGSATTVVDRGIDGTNLALQLTDNSSDPTLTTSPRAYSNTFGPLSTTATGENRFSGSFDYTRLLSANTTATAPIFQFVVASGGATASGSGTSAIQFTVDSNGHLSYLNGTTGVDSGFTLVTGTEYHIEIDSDFSSVTQDTWSLNVTPVGSTTPVLTRTGLGTRAANVAVNIVSFNGGVNGTAVNSAAFAQIDNINFESSAVPEPASMGLAVAGSLLALRRRSSARRSA